MNKNIISKILTAGFAFTGLLGIIGCENESEESKRKKELISIYESHSKIKNPTPAISFNLGEERYYARDIAIGDMNNDGKNDIIINCSEYNDGRGMQKIYVFLNNGNGTYSCQMRELYPESFSQDKK